MKTIKWQWAVIWIALFTVTCVIVGVRSASQVKAISMIERRGGYVTVWSRLPGWIPHIDEQWQPMLFCRVEVAFIDIHIEDQEWEEIEAAFDVLNGVSALALQGEMVNDVWLGHCKKSRARVLVLAGTHITDEGFKTLREWNFVRIIRSQDNRKISRSAIGQMQMVRPDLDML